MQAAGAARRSAVLTFLFSDIEGSTSAWERSPESMRQALRIHDAILDEETLRASGTVFKRTGDGFCCSFTTPDDALRAAVAIQRRLASAPWPNGTQPLRVRMGIHTGTAFTEAEDYFGPSLNRVARLMAAGHGGQILLSASTAALLRDGLDASIELRPLGTYRLKDLRQPETIFQVVTGGISVAFPSLNTLDTHANNLPSQISTFVGREVELRDLASLMKECRLVTICGPGGIGKTRLQLQLAADMVTAFKDGVWFISLASVNEPGLVVGAIAAALGIPERPGETYEETLLHYLAPRSLLLALDNSEHVLIDSALIAKHILERTPSVRIVCTSREPLHVRGEQIYRVGPLAEEDSAILFTERARELDRNFSPTAADQLEIVAICLQVQGIPLAVELAAARTASFSLQQIRRLLQAQLSFLSAPAVEDERHRTLRSTIAWSYDLLSDHEQQLLSRFSVFADAFTLEACEAIVPATADLLDLITSLADKSFVLVQRNNQDQTRYRLLEAIRSYAEAEASAELLASARKAHARFYLALAIDGTKPLRREELADWLRAVDADVANVRVALSYAFEKKETELGVALGGLRRYWYIKRKIAEGRGWLERYVASAEPADAALPAALRYLSSFACLQHDYGRAAEFAEEALHLYTEREDSGGRLAVKHALAVNEYRRGNMKAAEQLYREIAAVAEQSSDLSLLILALRNLATLKLLNGELPEAGEFLRRCKDYADKLGDSEQLASIEGLQGSLAYEQGDLPIAERHFERALEANTRLGNDFGVAETALGLASVRLRQGRTDAAKERIDSSLSLALSVESPDIAANALETYAEMQIGQGAWEDALKVFIAATTIRRAYCHAYSTKLGQGRVRAKLREHYGNDVDAATATSEGPDWKTTSQSWLAKMQQD